MKEWIIKIVEVLIKSGYVKLAGKILNAPYFIPRIRKCSNCGKVFITRKNTELCYKCKINYLSDKIVRVFDYSSKSEAYKMMNLDSIRERQKKLKKSRSYTAEEYQILVTYQNEKRKLKYQKCVNGIAQAQDCRANTPE